MYVIAPFYINICGSMSVNPLIPLGLLIICSLWIIYYLKETSETKLEDYLLEE